MEVEVLWNEDALNAIKKTYEYVRQRSPQIAIRLADDLIEFGSKLGNFPEKFKRCAIPGLAKKKFHCISFLNHIFVYKIFGNVLRIYKVFHASQDPRKLKI